RLLHWGATALGGSHRRFGSLPRSARQRHRPRATGSACLLAAGDDCWRPRRRTTPGFQDYSRQVRTAMQAHERGFFTEENSIEVVTGRNINAKNERVRTVMDVIIRKLHEAVKEIEPTQEEWFEAIQFLTRVGHMCDEWRQEFILLSDVLGVSMLVDAINNRKPSGASKRTVFQRFHVARAPELPMGTNICLDQKGEDMVIPGHVRDVEG